MGLRLIGLLALLTLGGERGPWLLIGRIPDRNPYTCSESVSGTYVPGSASITDGSCAVWTLGAGSTPNIVILRNGSQAAAAFGAQIEYYLGTLYVQGDNLAWYVWDDSLGSFQYYSATDPSMSVSPVGYFVSTTGSNGNSCMDATSASTPKRTLTDAVGCLAAGDTLWVRGGTYAESVAKCLIASGTSWSNKVRLANYPGETVWVTPPSSASEHVFEFSCTQHYIEIDGINMNGANVLYDTFKITDGVPGSYQAHHIRVQNLEAIGATRTGTGGSSPTGMIFMVAAGDSSTIGQNEFINITAHGGLKNDFDHAFYIESQGNHVEGCNIYDYTGAGVQIYNGHDTGSVPNNNVLFNNRVHDSRATVAGQRHEGFTIAIGTGNLAYNNVIWNIANNGSTAAGIATYFSTGTLLYNNTIYANPGNGMEIDSGSTGAILRNNISVSNGQDYSNSGTGTTASNNFCTSGCNINGNPLFITPGSDFHIAIGSPAKDVGTALASVFTTDIEGTPRPQGPLWDIGAYEYH